MQRPVGQSASYLRFRSLPHVQKRNFVISSVILDGKKSEQDSKAFSKTLLLPKTSFPLWANVAQTEDALKDKTCGSLYLWQRDNARGPSFVLHDGPPYANGHLHMGHALNKILKDIINRYHVSLGHKVHYVPGWDCHGLPIENKTLQDLGKDAQSLPPTAIREAARITAEIEIERQKSEFQALGIMADWGPENTYRTLGEDHDYEIRQLRVFQKMVEKGLIYRHYRPVHYSPSSRSALAEAELIYQDDHISHSVYISFKVDTKAGMNVAIQNLLVEQGVRNVYLLVWTTTPWTLTANMAIAIHPDMQYLIVKQKESRSDGLFILAAQRLSALHDVVGNVEILAEIKGSNLVNMHYHPIFSPLHSPASQEQSNSTLRILPSSHVTPDSGTGLVHCAPAHGPEDYSLFHSLGLLSASSPASTMLCHVGPLGTYTSAVKNVVGEEAGQRLVGKAVLNNGGKEIIKILEEMGDNQDGCRKVLVKKQRVKHRYPYDWKTREPIIVTATSQWFTNLDAIKEDALEALRQVKFYPPVSRNRLDSFIDSRSEWCISRQRVWGVPIPSLHHIPIFNPDSPQLPHSVNHEGTAHLTPSTLSHILDILDRKGVAYWWEGPVEEFVPPELKTEMAKKVKAETEVGANVEWEWKKGSDTMDVWFDSGSSWSMLEERGKETPKADVCLEGSDQHRGWFQSSLLTALGSSDETGKREVGSAGERKAPYGTLITHGMVLDQKGKKMSKSLGNIISPMTIIHGGKDKKKEPAYGADVLRLWSATVEYWRDMPLGQTVLSQSAESLRKIRNSARFALGNIGNKEARARCIPVDMEDMGLAERYVMHELYKLERTALDGYATYNFAKVANSLSNFANITLSALYFDITKDCLYANDPLSIERRRVVTVLQQILSTMMHVMAPILPHLAEEIHHAYENEGQELASGSSVFMKKWEPLSPEWENQTVDQEMTLLLAVRSAVLALLEKARGDRNIKSSLEAEVDLILPEDSTDSFMIELLRREESFLKTLFITSDASIMDEGSLDVLSPKWVYIGTTPIPGLSQELGIRVRPASKEKCPRCWTFMRPKEDILCERCCSAIRHQS